MGLYGDPPVNTGIIKIECKEMMLYQYLPVKLKDYGLGKIEDRLKPFQKLLEHCINDFKKEFGYEALCESYIYLTVKHQYQSKDKPMNRPGYHSDGFMTDDINYIWCDSNPTIFNLTNFNLTQDDEISLKEMEEQANPAYDYTYQPFMVLRLDQFNIHKVNTNAEHGFRTFAKVSFSKDRYNLEGNSKNYLLDYDWEMKPRKQQRNIPQQ